MKISSDLNLANEANATYIARAKRDASHRGEEFQTTKSKHKVALMELNNVRNEIVVLRHRLKNTEKKLVSKGSSFS